MTEVLRFIDAEKGNFPIAFMCGRLGASVSGYYAWIKRPPSTRAVADARLSTTIQLIHAGSVGRTERRECTPSYARSTASAAAASAWRA